MVMLYVGGHLMGRLPQDADVLTRLISEGERIELRDESGKRVGQVVPEPASLVPWDSTITREELDRRATEPGFTIDEVRAQLGWKCGR